MEIPKDMVMVKEYDNYILFENKKTKIRECFLKIDLDLIPERFTKRELERGKWRKW